MEHDSRSGDLSGPGGEPMADLPAAADPDHDAAPQLRGRLATCAYVVGGIGLVAATLSDAIAVAGRHTGFHLLGSIELVQGSVVLLASAGMLIATLARGHASVHIVTDRLRPAKAAALARLAALLSGLVFLAIAYGSVVVAAELWGGYEQTELLHLPMRWLRALWIGFSIVIALRFFMQAAAPAHRAEP